MNDQQLELDLFPLPPQGNLKDNPDAERFEMGETPENLARNRELARRAVVFSDAYSELGGGIQTAAENMELGDRYGEFEDNYQPWKKEIYTAFVQFDLAKLSPSEILKMDSKESNLLALHFDYFVESVEHRGRLLMTPGSEGSPQYAEYPFTDEQQAVVYGQELRDFAETIKASPAYDLLFEKAKTLKPKQHDRFKRVKDDRKKGSIVVAFDTRKQRLTAQLEPHHAKSIAS